MLVSIDFCYYDSMRIPTGYPPPPHMAYPGPYGYHPVYYGYPPYLPYAVSFVHCIYLKDNLIASTEYSFISKYCDVAKECLPLKEHPPLLSCRGSKFNSIQKKFAQMSTHPGVSFAWLMECNHGVTTRQLYVDECS